MTGLGTTGLGNILPWQGKHPRIAADAFVAHTAVVIGDVEIGRGSSIWYHCVLRGDLNEIRIGEDVNVQDGTVIHVDSRTFSTRIADRVTIGHMCLIHACTLEIGAMVGMQAVAMDGAVVGEGALLAAGALLPPGKRIPPGEIWAGRPARRVRQVTDEDRRQMLDYIWPHYRDLGHAYQDAGYDLRDARREGGRDDEDAAE